MTEIRLDTLLFKKGLISSRVQARDLILEGRVFIDSRPVRSPGKKINENSHIEIIETPVFVSRSGRKLYHFIKDSRENLDHKIKDKTIADIGASTGGFTEVLLHFKAKRIYSIDIGTSQLHNKLKNNPRIISMENTDIRDISSLPEEIDIAVADLSFISIKKVFMNIHNLLKASGLMIILIKPQFESSKDKITKKGILPVRYHSKIIEDLKSFFLSHDTKIIAFEKSFLEGKNKNIEYFILLEKQPQILS